MNHGLKQMETYMALREKLDDEPFLVYLGETDNLYHVRSGPSLALTLPKYRNAPEIYPQKLPKSLQNSQRWLAWALVGLLFAGLGAVIFAPFAAASSLAALLHPVDEQNRRRALLNFCLAAVLWLLALPIGYLFLLHF